MVDPQNIKAISEWHVPEDTADIRSFMGLTSYYQRFIQGFLKISYHITSLQRNGVKFQEIFENLKRLLTMAVIMKVAGPYKQYTICIDAS